jgi:hypothetical protein
VHSRFSARFVRAFESKKALVFSRPAEGTLCFSSTRRHWLRVSSGCQTGHKWTTVACDTVYRTKQLSHAGHAVVSPELEQPATSRARPTSHAIGSWSSQRSTEIKRFAVTGLRIRNSGVARSPSEEKRARVLGYFGSKSANIVQRNEFAFSSVRFSSSGLNSGVERIRLG